MHPEYIYFVGTWSDSHPRNISLSNIFNHNEFKIIDKRAPISISSSGIIALILDKPFKNVWIIVLNILKSIIKTISIPKGSRVLIGFPSHVDLLLIPLLKIKKCKIILDFLIASSEALVIDRQLTRSDVILKALTKIDKYLIYSSNLVVFDTKENESFFKGLYPNINSSLIISAFPDLSVITKQNFSYQSKINKPYILWFGSYSKFHGLEEFLNMLSALECDSCETIFIGNGQEKNKIIEIAKKSQIRNIHFISTVSVNELIKFIIDARLVLGIGKNSKKYERVVPQKVWLSLALGTPIFTVDSILLKNTFSEGILYFSENDYKKTGLALVDALSEASIVDRKNLRVETFNKIQLALKNESVAAKEKLVSI